ncbi:MAG: ATP-binding protein [Microcoleus sp. SU_5_3]|nr:ATP-binding protein [Microcoleus sp. SU_5_3]
MKANPGGAIAPAEVMGRDKLIFDLWGILEQQSVILSAERRMGKTSVIKKMRSEATADKLPIYRDLESVKSPLEFVETVFQDVETYLTGLKRHAKKARAFLTQLGGTEFSGFKLPDIAAPHWKNLLTQTIADLVENQDRTVILLWDEVPYMLDNIGDAAAMELLDTLRSIRQMYPAVRMVYTGSIGLHHVLNVLRKAGYTNDPTNDMYVQDVPPLSVKDATNLARKLLEGENIVTPDIQGSAVFIADELSNIPFYIHHLIAKLKLRGGSADIAAIKETIADCLDDPLNPWKMEHYRDRLDSYYDDKQRPYALNLLDILAAAGGALSFDELFSGIKQESETQDKEMARKVVRMLEQDYYIYKQDGRFQFWYALIQKYWKSLRC